MSKLATPPVNGKTYSLFAENNSTEQFYSLINQIADKLTECTDHNDLLPLLEDISRKKSNFNKWLLKNLWFEDELKNLSQFTKNVESHLKEISLIKQIRDKRLGLKEWQYHLFMLEFLVTNRANKIQFLNADKKIALLPHCLRQKADDCKAVKDEIDYQCTFCSSGCFIFHASKILQKKGITPYLWMNLSLTRFAKKTLKEGSSLGILGIACIPELVMGMRKCRSAGLPVVGIPLNANRCSRWMGKLHQTNVDLEELEKLVSDYFEPQ